MPLQEVLPSHRSEFGRLNIPFLMVLLHLLSYLLISPYSVETVSFLSSNAARKVCHGNVAHFTLTGNSRTPEKTASFPSSPLSNTVSMSPVTRRCNLSKSISASARVFPFMLAVISEADALEIAHPEPWKLISL